MQKKALIIVIIVGFIASGLVGGLVGFLASRQLLAGQPTVNKQIISQVEEQSDIIKTAEQASPAVVSIIVSKDLPKLQRVQGSLPPSLKEFFNDDPFFQQFFSQPSYEQPGTEKTEIGGGTGFIISTDGYIITNRHVVYDDSAEYTVLLNDETKYPAEVLAKDTLNDIAVLKIDAKDLPILELGDSSQLKVGQTVIAIGNALGEFRNTVSTGVVSGLSRSITAYGAEIGSQNLIGLIQTDASINSGNSGGPLLDLGGQVIGINVAMASGQNIGFALPINQVKEAIKSVQEHGRIIRAWLGVRYVQIDKTLAEKNKLEYDYGALIIRGDQPTDLAVMPGSPADQAGLMENDIILEVNGAKLTTDNYLAKIIAEHQPGDKIKLKIVHRGETKNIEVNLTESK